MKFQQGRFTRWLQQLFCVLLGSLLLYLPAVVVAQDVLPVPALTARVIDQTATLTEAERQEMEAKLAAYEHSKGSQIVVLMVESTQPEDIASYANRVASTWKIGRRDVGDGVLVIVAKGDRRMRIEVARALEGTLPDLTAARILDVAMKPEFRNGNYAGGISAALDLIMKAIDGEELPAVKQVPAEQGTEDDSGGWTAVALMAILVIPALIGEKIMDAMGRGKGSLVTGALAGVVAFFLFLSQFPVFMAVSAALWLGIEVCMVVFFITLMTGGYENAGSSSGGSGSRSSPIIVSSRSSGGGFRSSGGSRSSGGFRSGGGGSFGGGGASGGW